jgi:hypothetical protein
MPAGPTQVGRTPDAGPVQNPALLTDLPDDLPLLILAGQSAGAASTCRRFRALVLQQVRARTLTFGGSDLSAHFSDGIRAVATRLPNLEQLHMCGAPAAIPCAALGPLSHLTRLSRLDVAYGHLALARTSANAADLDDGSVFPVVGVGPCCVAGSRARAGRLELLLPLASSLRELRLSRLVLCPEDARTRAAQRSDTPGREP